MVELAPLQVLLRLYTLAISLSMSLVRLAADCVRGNKGAVRVNRPATESAAEDSDRCQHKSRSNLREGGELLILPLRALLQPPFVRGVGNLVVSDPDLPVQEEERHDSVDEGLGLRVSSRRTEDLGQEFLHQLRFRPHIKSRVKRKQRTRSEHAVPRQLELVHGVHIAHVKLHARPRRLLRDPHVKVLPLARLEVQAKVAALDVSNLVDGAEVPFGVELGVFLLVRQQLA
mmetsp:Transcript_11034/g.41201  ORF Transcript_11034/g.41201 Transcript_11034/m.41201 type:complete len:230 (+) Transcript_11034:76-765(+)